ncbi:Poly(3-hydroxyalkanoate) polymerase subunit PhaC [Thalassocella blandensis]|nr:Poly(3-hydroxyalkanoate) polymerase subunit PhaC [Thalassocella blandensis]
MNSHDKQEILGYIEKFSGIFNDMMGEVTERIVKQQIHADLNPFQEDLSSRVAEFNTKVHVDPKKFVEQQLEFLEKQQQLWQNASRAMLGEQFVPIVSSAGDDKRFQDGDWDGNPAFAYIKQAYLLNAEYMNKLVDALDFEDKKIKEQVRFYTRQFINSLAPTNYVLTNPEVCREILATQGENLARGIDNFMRDLKNSPNEAFKITQVDIDAFTLGENLATTKGKVVFQNALIQLLQYEPKQPEVYQRPLLFFPPFINKYYILDLDQQKSMVQWLLEQGYTVFMVSWVNPDEQHRDITFSDYLFKGVIESLDAVESITGAKDINTVGYCIGGTLLAMAQAYLTAKGEKRIHSMSLFTTLLDFSEPGEVGNYVSRQLLPMVEQSIASKGYFDGRILALSFSLLRENNLFWSFFIDNYLKGKDPTPFDILYWNSDSTNVPGKAFLYYLNNMYLENNLVKPGAINVAGIPIDITEIDIPTYCLTAQADHIVLWQSAYKGAKKIGSNVSSKKPSDILRFVMTESGHVAGVVNPPSKGKYPYWVNENLPETHEQWLAGAQQQAGSWWSDWHQWLQTKSGEKVKAMPELGNKQYPPRGDAPGSYVRRRLEASEAKNAD